MKDAVNQAIADTISLYGGTSGVMTMFVVDKHGLVAICPDKRIDPMGDHLFCKKYLYVWEIEHGYPEMKPAYYQLPLFTVIPQGE